MNFEREINRAMSKASNEDIEQELLSAEALWQQVQNDGFLEPEGGVLQKWVDVILHANPNVVCQELQRILELVTLQEEVLSSLGASSRVDELYRQMHSDSTLRERIEMAKQNFAIQSMGNILSSE